MEYRKRVVDALLGQRLSRAAAVVLEGPRGAGVSTSAGRVAGHVWSMSNDEYARQFVDMSPQILFAASGGRPPVLFDEWHETPRLLGQVHQHVTADPTPGRLLLAASRTPREAAVRETHDGDLAWLRMRPMSLWESGHSTGEVSLEELFRRRGDSLGAHESPLDAHELFERMVVGGWPALLGLPEEKARRWLRDHLHALVRADLPAQGARRSSDDLRRFLATLAAGVGTEQKLAEVARSMHSTGSTGRSPALRPETVAEYLSALDRLLLLEDVPAWSPILTSAAAVRRAPRRFFTDPSVGLAALGTGSAGLKKNLALAARHFEALVVRDLRTYADVIDGRLHHLRDNNGRTVDLVIELPDGAWGAVQVRMNPAGADEGAAGLRWIDAKVDRDHHPDPSFLAVVTGTGVAARRPDGVLTVPIGSLAP